MTAGPTRFTTAEFDVAAAHAASVLRRNFERCCPSPAGVFRGSARLVEFSVQTFLAPD
jgi:hypothetical protein